MNKAIILTIGSGFLLLSSLVHAGAELTPGNYRAAPTYQDGIHDLFPPASACIYIGAPNADGQFLASLVFDGGSVYKMGCTRLSKGKVKAGKPPKVKEDASKEVSCAGSDAGPIFYLSLRFQISRKGEKARLKKLQGALGLLGPPAGVPTNIVFADAVLDPVTCNMPPPANAPLTAPEDQVDPFGG